MRALSSLPSSIGASVWPADELLCVTDRVVASGHAALDAELPGGGWPLGALVELLQPAPTSAVWSLLLPALAERVRDASAGAARQKMVRSNRVVVVNPPHEPYLPAMAAAGVPAAHLLWLAADAPSAQLWATEQALRCQDVAVVVAWLPRVQLSELRRLQQAAAQTGALLFVLRPDRAAQAASPARVRLRVAAEVPAPRRPRLQLVGEGDLPPTPHATHGLPALRVDVLKRRGPPLDQPLWLPVCSARVWAVAQAALAPARATVMPTHPSAQPVGLPASQAMMAIAPMRPAPVEPIDAQSVRQLPIRTRASPAISSTRSRSRSSRRARSQPLSILSTPEVRHALAGIAVAA